MGFLDDWLADPSYNAPSRESTDLRRSVTTWADNCTVEVYAQVMETEYYEQVSIGALKDTCSGQLRRPVPMATDRASSSQALIWKPRLYVPLGTEVETGDFVKIISTSGAATMYVASEIDPIDDPVHGDIGISLEATA